MRSTLRLNILTGLTCLAHGVSAQVQSPAWSAAYNKAQVSVAKLNITEKVILATGEGLLLGNCVGNIPPIPSINFPGLCLQDSALGVQWTDGNSAFPAGINAAATFNKTLMYERGVAMGQEFRGKGVNVQLGPYMNLMRIPAAGRAWEGFGGDPYLSGEGAFETISGIQSQGVQAVAKHFINNEQEHSRMTSSSNVDDRNMKSTFIRVQANVAAFMCSYNLVNGTYACEKNATLNGVLKNELAFQGYVMSDWNATHSTADSANHGLDMTMPGGALLSFFGVNLVSAVESGLVPESRLDDMATRILAAWYLLGQDSNYPATNFNGHGPIDLDPTDEHLNVQGDHANLIRLIGAASTVLLKNERNALPLNKPKTIAVIGSGAGSNPLGPNGCIDRTCNVGVLGMGWGSGTANYPYLIAPLDAITNRSHTDGTVVLSSLSDSDLTTAAYISADKDVSFVFITADSGEQFDVEGNVADRKDLFAWHGGDALVDAVARVNNNTIVVVNTVGPIVVEAWIDHPNVTGLVWSGLPGQEAGNALVDVLYGAYNPSGRLPYTIAKAESDYPVQINTNSSSAIIQIPYNEGLFIDYRHFDAAGIVPRYEFGFGLSYTTFKYLDLSISGTITPGNPKTGLGASVDTELHETVITISFIVKNTGSIAGHEVPQLYLSFPPSVNEPPNVLRGFESVHLNPGESKTVTLELSRYSLSIWDVVSQKWTIPSGTFGLNIGASSRDIRLTGTLMN